ncbi:MAG: malto-oligosyltrehalose synthase [Chloroflexi bacterium]|nr:malto-oligosyltrehalose synthase [Chloroflexota bacterium]
MAAPRIPLATYRVQLNRDFGFEAAASLVAYLEELGISDLYASPLLTARPGSRHGYDTTDPTRLNPELGEEAGFERLVAGLKKRGMGLLLDIVPNHLAVSPENPWWADLLENGESSPYALYFDIDWEAGGGRVVLPVLGRPYREALADREITVALESGGLFIRYYDDRFPLGPASVGQILAQAAGGLRGAEPALAAALDRVAAGHAALPPGARREERAGVGRELERLLGLPEIRRAILPRLTTMNGVKGDPASFAALDRLLGAQVYELVFWREGLARLNYRRFFDVSTLIGVCAEAPAVFAATHDFLLGLARRGAVTGLRVDHIDGLKDPRLYLERLRSRLGEPSAAGYVVVEKILAWDESLPGSWPVEGTTGYEFLNRANHVLVNGTSSARMSEIYRGFTGNALPYDDVIYRRKKQVMRELFPAEINSLARRLVRLAGGRFPEAALRRALVELTACLAVYRTYISDSAASGRDVACLEQAFRRAGERGQAESGPLEFLRGLFAGRPKGVEALDFIRRWQQATGAVTAKGVEDTAFYVYNRLVSLNEVGGDPGIFGITVTDFHEYNRARLERRPHTLNATSTHDTKRSEDVRQRINVLSEIPEEWAGCLARWSGRNAAKKTALSGLAMPEPNMEILVYQDMLGAYPLQEAEVPEFRERFQGYLLKAAREAKTFTSWLGPDGAYEAALRDFAGRLFEDAPFMTDFRKLQAKVAFYGAVNSLAQLALKAAAPGVPDFYQGTELWRFSLVDPDNRREVYFAAARRLLSGIQEGERWDRQRFIGEMLASWWDGRVKLYLTWRSLQLRRECAAVFQSGNYIPVPVCGAKKDNVIAFMREHADRRVLVVAPRLPASLAPPGVWPLGGVWGDTCLELPPDAPQDWRGVLDGAAVRGPRPRVGDILNLLPVALLAG